MEIEILTDILAANDAVAADNRLLCEEAGVVMINVMSSPGSGKTTLLEKAVGALRGRVRVGVIEGDIATSRDAERLVKTGIPVVQVNTGTSCHLNATMVNRALARLVLKHLDVVFVENVGNLVCPAEFDLGELHKVMLLSVTEGDEKPLKYPAMFRSCTALVINKLDLLPYTNFNLSEAIANARSINPDLTIFPLSCTTGDGLDAWLAWLIARVKRLGSRG